MEHSPSTQELLDAGVLWWDSNVRTCRTVRDLETERLVTIHQPVEDCVPELIERYGAENIRFAGVYDPDTGRIKQHPNWWGVFVMADAVIEYLLNAPDPSAES